MRGAGLFAAAMIAAAPVIAATPAAPAPAAQTLQDLRSFATVATLLHVAAHPDDENTALITYFARGRGYRTGYLSLTRGDGGQNELGAEFDEKLGVARTQELLAARQLDGGSQFFTRAIDFGYSKSVDETLAFWNRREVLGDVVRVYRTFRPDVVVTRFSPAPGGTHGHHTASAVLALEAFKLAGDPTAYPEQLQQGLTVWQPKRILWNGFGGSARGGGGGPTGPIVRVDIGGDDPVSGTPFGVIAARSRGMHITQGFAGYAARGSSGPNEQSFVHLAGDVAKNDVMDGIDTAWTRVAGGTEIAKLAAAAVAQFKADDPAASVPALLAIRAKLAALPADPVVADKRAQLDRILQACLALKVRSVAAQPEVVPGEQLAATFSAEASGKVPVKLLSVQWLGRPVAGAAGALAVGAAKTFTATAAVPRDTALTQPYWLRADGSSGIARVDDPSLIGLPENPAAFPVQFVFEVGGQTLTVTDDLVFVEKTAKGEGLRRVDVIPPVSLRFVSDVALIAPGASRAVAVEVTGARGAAHGELSLELPAGWRAAPAKQSFKLGAVGAKATLTFEVTAPAQPGTGRMTAAATVDGTRYANQRIAIDYAHLPLMLLQPLARARLVAQDVAVRGKNVGYLPGAGDATAEALTQLGYTVKTLTGADLTLEKLRPLDAVVLGVRAFNERKDLAANLPGLFAYVEAGGTVIAQYNRPNGLLAETLAPFPLSIAGSAPALRVTDEKAPVTFLTAGHPLLAAPNRIGPADFEGWVQERGLYFPSKWDEARFEPVLAMNDPGEAPLRSSVLVAKHGRGHYVYTGLAFFRQLPAGVPGAYRLFANLVSLGK